MVPILAEHYKAMKTTKAETSLTRELTTKYNFTKNTLFETTMYKSSVSDVLNRGTSTNAYNEIIDIKQEGIENSFIFKNDNQLLKISNTFSKK